MRKEIDKELEQKARNSANAVLKGLNKIELKEINGMDTAKDESELLMSAAGMVELLNQLTGYDAEKVKQRDQIVLDEMESIRGKEVNYLNKQARVEGDAFLMTYYFDKVKKAYEYALTTISDGVISKDAYDQLVKATEDFDIFYRHYYFDAAEVVQNPDVMGRNEFSVSNTRFDNIEDCHDFKEDFEWIIDRLEKNIENYQKNLESGNYIECSDALSSIFFLNYDLPALIDAQGQIINEKA